MNPSYYRISLDIHEATSQLSFSIKKGDTNRRLVVSLTDNGVPYAIDKDCYAVFSARKADGSLVFNDCTIKNNMIVYDVTEQTTILEGRLDCEITLYGENSQQITSPRFTIIVYATVFSEEDIESSEEYGVLGNLVAESITLKNDIERALANSDLKIVSTELIDQDETGNSIYQQTFGNGNTTQFTVPRGSRWFIADKTTPQILNGVSIYDYTYQKGDLCIVKDYLNSGRTSICIYNGKTWQVLIDNIRGDQGEQGIQGEKGDQGEQGIQGEKGDQGEQGIQGEKGDQGEQGIQGEKGDKGDKGSNGANGINGITPKLQINETTNYWEVSYDEGETWESLGVKANSSSGGTTVKVNGEAVEEFDADTKVDKITPPTSPNGSNYAYSVYRAGNSSGATISPKLIEVSGSNKVETIPLRLSNGVVYVGSPTVGGHAANKEYVDTELAKKSSLFKHNVTISLTLGDPDNDIALYNKYYQIVTFLPTSTALTEDEIKSKVFSVTNGDFIVEGPTAPNGWNWQQDDVMYRFSFESDGMFINASPIENINELWEMVQSIDLITDTVEV